MPHIIIEYSKNIREPLQPAAFVQKLHDAAMSTGEFSAVALRTRASERDCYRVGDGHPDNGFVHIVMRIRPGRDRETKRRMGEKLFAAICEYLDPIFKTRPLGLTFEIQEIETDFRFLKNNMEQYLSAHQTAAVK